MSQAAHIVMSSLDNPIKIVSKLLIIEVKMRIEQLSWIHHVPRHPGNEKLRNGFEANKIIEMPLSGSERLFG